MVSIYLAAHNLYGHMGAILTFKKFANGYEYIFAKLSFTDNQTFYEYFIASYYAYLDV